VSIGHYRSTAGTLGAVVRCRNTGALLLLSNNHVLANATDGNDDRATAGDPIYQPGPYDGGGPNDLAARLERFVPIMRDNVDISCPLARRFLCVANGLLQAVRPAYRLTMVRRRAADNVVDAAVARPIPGEGVSPEILELGVPRGVVEPEIGAGVLKSGRTTGVTKGTIRVMHATVRISLGSDSALFSEQIVLTPMALPGDSGALVVTDDLAAVGLVSAGSDKATVAGAVSAASDLLRVDIVTEAAGARVA